MSKSKHTPGKWSYSAIDNLILSKEGSGATIVIAEISKGSNELKSKRLIAAAPEMLEALKNLFKSGAIYTLGTECSDPKCKCEGNDRHKALAKQVFDAIAKAEGKDE